MLLMNDKNEAPVVLLFVVDKNVAYIFGDRLDRRRR